MAGISQYAPTLDFIGDSQDARVQDGDKAEARLNEPNGCFSKVAADGSFVGLYIADTGNDCIRFACPEGQVETLDLIDVPDVRTTNGDCVGRQCEGNFDMGSSSDEEEESKNNSE